MVVGPTGQSPEIKTVEVADYLYSPLSQDSNIRLLRLLPHQDQNAPIKCEIFEYPLRASVKGPHLYEALSYVWGSEEGKKPVRIQSNEKSHQLLVTLNLHDALSHLRNPLMERVLWIDAVCINQRDDDEKGLQVQSMAEIYAAASCVVVWLGVASEGSAMAFDELGKAARREIKDRPNFISKREAGAVFGVLRRPWFQRIWVIQEVGAARRILIKCGHSEMEGVAFCSALSVLQLAYYSSPGLQGLIPSIAYLIRDAIFRPRYESGQQWAFSLRSHTLPELFDMYQNCKASQQIDKVYALIGMSSSDSKETKISVDYKAIWEDVAKKLIYLSLSQEIYVDLWCEQGFAMIQGPGYVLGWVHSVVTSTDRNDMQIIGIS